MAGRSQCTITFDKPMNAIQAVMCLNNHLIHGSQLSVSLVPFQSKHSSTSKSSEKPYF